MPTPNGQLYAMYVIFKDGNKRLRYSRDWKRGRDKKARQRDKIQGLFSCINYLKKFENKVKIFEIYDHHPGKPYDGEKVFKWNLGTVSIDLITHLVRR